MNSRTDAGMERAERRPRPLAIALASAFVVFTLAEPGVGETPDQTGTLEIEITNIASDAGTIAVAVLDSAAQYDAGDRPYRSDGKVPIRDRRAEVRFEDLPFGDYAVKVFHDENGNGELDTNWVGFPSEGFGFSNDAMGRFGPPSFDEAAFEIVSDPHRIRITMK